MKVNLFITENVSIDVRTYSCTFEKFLERERIEFDPKVDVTIVCRETSYDLDGFLASRARREFSGKYDVVVISFFDEYSMPRKCVFLRFLEEA